jgi:hypothetical protein
LLLGQSGETPFQIVKFEPSSLIGRDHQPRVSLLQFYILAVPRIATRMADVLAI